jgi:hypothetical protein
MSTGLCDVYADKTTPNPLLFSRRGLGVVESYFSFDTAGIMAMNES